MLEALWRHGAPLPAPGVCLRHADDTRHCRAIYAISMPLISLPLIAYDVSEDVTAMRASMSASDEDARGDRD